MKQLTSKKHALISFWAMTLLLASSVGLGATKPIQASLSTKHKVAKDKKIDEVIKQTTTGRDRTVTTTTYTEQCRIELKIRSTGEPTSCDLQWCFFAKDVESDKIIAFSPGKKTLTLPGAGVLNETINSTDFTVTRISMDTSNSEDKLSGSNYEGYLILILQDGEILAKKSNTSRYAKDEWIELCLNPPAPTGKKGNKKHKKKNQ